MNNFDLYIVTGNAGTGKSTVGEKIGKSLGAQVLDLDLMRQELGIIKYDRADTPRVMEAIFNRIDDALRIRKPAILCTAYLRRSSREQSYEQLNEISYEISQRLHAVLIRCFCEEEIAKARIEARVIRDDIHCPGNDPAIYDRYKLSDEPISTDEINQNPNISFLAYDSSKNQITRIAVRPYHQARIQVVESLITEV